jgi:homoserine/homoserine lactone efflux protein
VDLNLFLGFVAAVTVLMLLPGPNVALIVANSVAHGPRFGILTVAGTSSAMIVQLLLTGLGMRELLGTLGSWFGWLRWIGVAYLLYLGLRQWVAPAVDLTRTPAEPKSPRAIFVRAFFVSMTNPKTLLFYGAFFPQFISPGAHSGTQIVLLSVTFFAIAVLVDGSWALLAGRLRWLLAARGKLRNRLSGGMLIGAAGALALARRGQ